MATQLEGGDTNWVRKRNVGKSIEKRRKMITSDFMNDWVLEWVGFIICVFDCKKMRRGTGKAGKKEEWMTVDRGYIYEQ